MVCLALSCGSGLAKVIGTDLWKTAVGVVVSVVIALSIQPLAQLTAG